VEVVGKLHHKMSNRFVVSERVHVSGDITIARGTVREHIKISTKDIL
jgi:hypothetical protein